MLLLKAAAGWVMVTLRVAEQPLASVMVHVQVPALSPVTLAEVCTGVVFQE